jgi:hypothetical protein
MSELNLTEADDISLEAFYDASAKQDWSEPAEHLEIDRWTNYGHDRLYINAGISKCSKYSLYVDLQNHEIVSDNEGKHSGGSVTINGDTAEIVIEESGDKEHVITVSLDGEGFEANDDSDDEDDAETELVADGGEDTTDDVSDAEISESIDKHDTPGHAEATTVGQVRDTLARINNDVLDWWSEHQDAIDEGALEIVHEDRDSIVLADHSGHFWTEQFDALDIVDKPLRTIVTSLHHKRARARCDYSWSAVDPVVVRKTADFRAGEQQVLREVARRTAELGSVARAVDTLATETHGWSKSNWASLTDRNPSTLTRTTDN